MYAFWYLIIVYYISPGRKEKEWPSVFPERQLGSICCRKGVPACSSSLNPPIYSSNFREVTAFLYYTLVFSKKKQLHDGIANKIKCVNAWFVENLCATFRNYFFSFWIDNEIRWWIHFTPERTNVEIYGKKIMFERNRVRYLNVLTCIFL